MKDERWILVDHLLGGALEREPDQRAAFLDEACAGDEALRHEVESLLGHHTNAGEFLESPALELLNAIPTAETRAPLVDRQLGSYRIVSLLGAGGMGEVYQARDTKLDRDVAIKVLRPDVLVDDDRRRRFIREARAASTLNHPNIVTIHDIQQAEGLDFIVMEYVRGKSLDQVIPESGLPVDRALEYAAQIASAIADAHGAGVVHRDIKPANIVLSQTGRLKVLDFGLAKLIDQVPETSATNVTSTIGERTGAILGTPAYMSPEQARGVPVSAKSDVFSFGAVLYEMLAGRRPFAGPTPLDTLTKIVGEAPPPLNSRRADVPAALLRLADACLQKDPDARPTASEIVPRLQAIQRRLATAPLQRTRLVVAVSLVAVVVGSLGLTWASWSSSARIQRALAAVPQIQRLADESDYDGAFRLARESIEKLPNDSQLKQLWLNVTVLASIRTEPSGADVAIKGYLARDAPWYPLGRTPLENIRVPFGPVRLLISAKGYDTLEVSGGGAAVFGRGVAYRLDQTGNTPPGMVRVLRGPTQFANIGAQVSDFWIDRHEVTNRQFKEFVDAGGYRQRKYWHEPFILNGRQLTWEEAMARFVDATGREGPATWELGTYPDGQAEFPVTGVSWYEAAAYSAFAGRSLPTGFHWSRAAGYSPVVDIVGVSNFTGKGPAPIGRYGGLGPFGTYDMAGNVKEWAWNDVGDRRLVLGGAWNEPAYRFWNADAAAPFDRQPNLGFRSAKYIEQPTAAVTAHIPSQNLVFFDLGKERPVSDEIFKVYQALYRYDPRPLNASLESTEDTPQWRKETVSFDAAYGAEQVRAYLFLPKNVSAPFQVVVGFPSAEGLTLRSSRDLSLRWVDFVIRGGRALLYPIFKGTFERGPSSLGVGPLAARDEVIAWSKDLGRSIDYLETRADIDRHRIGYFGVSAGAEAGLILTALEPRLRASVLQAAGPVLWGRQPPEIHFVNFAPRVRVPTLLLYGRNDLNYPVDTFQVPLFQLLGTPTEQKHHTTLEGGHTPARQQDVIREVVRWFDEHLGPVTAK